MILQSDWLMGVVRLDPEWRVSVSPCFADIIHEQDWSFPREDSPLRASSAALPSPVQRWETDLWYTDESRLFPLLNAWRKCNIYFSCSQSFISWLISFIKAEIWQAFLSSTAPKHILSLFHLLVYCPSLI